MEVYNHKEFELLEWKAKKQYEESSKIGLW